MKIIFLDIETTDTLLNKKRNPSPFLPTNELVSVGYKTRGYRIERNDYLFFNHHEGQTEGAFLKLQSDLNEADLLVAHHTQFDVTWLLEAGFKLPKDLKLYCTMIGEYILAKAVKVELSLDASCIRRNTIQKQGHLVQDYWDKGLSFNQIPAKVVEEYGRADVAALEGLYDAQQALLELPENISLLPTIQMSNEFTWVLIDMIRAGIYIDDKALADVKAEFEAEQKSLKKELEAIVREVMGDTPINLDSPEQLSWLIYSRKVKDKHVWTKTFNIGTDERGKRRKAPRMAPTSFVELVKRNTERLFKTHAQHCEECHGTGVLDKLTKSGEPYKRMPKCSQCNGAGFRLVNTGTVAGFRLSPTGPQDTASGGFATDADTIKLLEKRLKLSGKIDKEPYFSASIFLSKYSRYNAIATYLSTFVGGIERNRGLDGLLHTKLNQCVTSTGRLSSTDPNFQNMPRSGTFPVKRVVKSRWKDGEILEFDFKTLEFCVAGFIYQDQKVIDDIINKVDVHSFTSNTLTDAGQSTNRQDAKPHTFKPLYGGSSGTEAEQAYYRAFKEKYKGVAEGQQRDIQIVLETGTLTIPSGRQYSFPGTRRTPSGYVTNTTQICNYPVQGFATADIVPVAIIDIHEEMLNEGFNSLLILTVHDNCVFDVYPGERDRLRACISKCIDRLPDILKARYNTDINVPLGIEFKHGPNWLELH